MINRKVYIISIVVIIFSFAFFVFKMQTNKTDNSIKKTYNLQEVAEIKEGEKDIQKEENILINSIQSNKDTLYIEELSNIETDCIDERQLFIENISILYDYFTIYRVELIKESVKEHLELYSDIGNYEKPLINSDSISLDENKYTFEIYLNDKEYLIITLENEVDDVIKIHDIQIEHVINDI